MKSILVLRRLALVRAAAILLVMTTGLGWYLTSSSPSAKAATSDDILFIHGFAGGNGGGSINTVPGGCGGTWSAAKNYFRLHGWTGNLLTVGYYRGDWQGGNSCDIQFDSQAPNTNHEPVCDNYPASHPLTASDEGTNNQDLGNIACQLAWYIFNTYTAYSKNVHVIAHSMGGLIIRYALDRVNAHDPAFPAYLYVPTVVTIATPHNGIPVVSAWWLCDGCTMLSNMETFGGDPAYFINTLRAETTAPMGSPGEPTQWTLMASNCETWVEGLKGGVPDDSALTFPNSDNGLPASGYPIVYKYDYTTVPNTGGCPNNYLHGDFLTDQSDAFDATADDCYDCSYPLPTNNATVSHSLAIAFQNTSVIVPAAPLYGVMNLINGGAFFDKWQQLGGVSGTLGDPTDDWFVAQNGNAQDFQHGGLYWSPATNTHEVHGAIYTEYVNAMHGPTSALGFPLTDEQGISGVNGRVSYFAGQVCAGGYGVSGQTTGSAIFYGTSAHEVQGCIYHLYMVTWGGPGGLLGFPTTDEQAISTGRVSYFAGQSCNGGGPNGSGSAIYYSSATSTHVVEGCIYAEYIQYMNGPAGKLGFPITDQLSAANGGSVSYFANNVCAGGYVVNGQTTGSAIFYNSSVVSFANEVQGCIYQKYMSPAMGGPGGVLGYPVWDEIGITGTGNVAGRVSYFAKNVCVTPGPHGSGSAIYYSSASGTHEVQGCIYYEYWHNLSGPAGCLGFPTSDEQSANDGVPGDRESFFQHGYIIWHTNGSITPSC